MHVKPTFIVIATVLGGVLLAGSPTAKPADTAYYAVPPDASRQPATIWQAKRKPERPSSYILYDYLSDSSAAEKEKADEEKEEAEANFWQQNNWR